MRFSPLLPSFCMAGPCPRPEDLALVDDADAVGHLLGLFDVMVVRMMVTPFGLHAPHHFPHPFAATHIGRPRSARRGTHLRSWGKRLRNHHPALHAAGTE